MLKQGALKKNMDLAEQQILDCGFNSLEHSGAKPPCSLCKGMFGCKGAWPNAYIGFMAQEGGLDWSHEQQYPYEQWTEGNCREKETWDSGALVTKSINDFGCNEDKLKQLVYEYGSVVTVIHASEPSFGNYDGGVYTGCSPDDYADHAVAVVGYGTENGDDYWIVKNSWGHWWGDQGYIKMKRGVGECWIGSMCFAAECTATGTGEPAPNTALREAAREACKAFGADWCVGKEGFGSLECHTSCDKWYHICGTTDNYRIVVWEDGYGNPSDVDGYGGTQQGQFSTTAGYYYGGQNPCAWGDNLGEGYPWLEDNTGKQTWSYLHCM